MDEDWEKFYSAMAMLGLLMNGNYTIGEIVPLSKGMAKRMMMDEEDGINVLRVRRRHDD